MLYLVSATDNFTNVVEFEYGSWWKNFIANIRFMLTSKSCFKKKSCKSTKIKLKFQGGGIFPGKSDDKMLWIGYLGMS